MAVVNLEDKEKKIPFKFFLLMYILYHIENHISRETCNIYIMSKKVKNYRKNLQFYVFIYPQKER